MSGGWRISTVAVALALAVAAARPIGAADAYWAFGDSNVWAEYFDRENLDATQCSGKPWWVFEAPPTHPYPTNCGFAVRLQSQLGKTVYNRGFPSESTSTPQFGSPGAVTRIGLPNEPLEIDRCADPEAGHTLLLKHGTNDAGILSTNTIRTNLEYMVDLATSKCYNTAIAGVIRRIFPGNYPLDTPIGDPYHVPTTDIAVAAFGIAASRNRKYVPVWDLLCFDQTTCFSPYYQDRTHLNDPGHLNDLGHDEATTIFRTAIEWRPPAGVASGQSPVGQSIPWGDMVLAWDEWDTANGFNTGNDWYFLEVTGPASHGRWYPEEAICAAGTCQLRPFATPPAGAYSWRVRTRNLRGVGQWTAQQPLTVLDCPTDVRVLENQTVTGAATEQACTWLYAGNFGTGDYTITGAGADVVFDSGSWIALENGFSIGPDARFEARLD